MSTRLERPTESPPDLRQVFADFGVLYASNGFISWLFAVSAPVAIILAVGANGGLSENEIASWIFGVFFVNGLITVLFCWLYRQPLIMCGRFPARFWSVSH
jgi:benzoate membrane transport protein